MNKKAISTLAIVLIASGIIALAVLVYTQMGNVATDEGFIKVRLYDANGNPITPALSIVSNVEGVRYIDLTITATSSGSVPLSCSLSIPDTKVNSQIPPNVFSNALPDNTPKILSGIGSKVEWTTSLIDISGLESTPTPDVFSTKVICSYTDASGTNYLEQTGNVSITIGPEGSTGFEVNVNSGGLPSLWCGDNICSSGENATSCPADCGGTISKVNFRTSDLSYPLGSAIAYNPGTCGNALTQYGYDTTTCWTVTDATCPTTSGYTRVLGSKNIQGKPSWSTNTACLYNLTNDATQMALAWKVTTTSSSPCGTAGQWGVIKFNTGSSYKNKASTAGTLINVQRDLICP